jgi:enolase
MGKGVQKAVGNVKTTIRTALLGAEVSDLEKIDAKLLSLDGTENKATLGANAILGVSLATAKALAVSQGASLFKTLKPSGPYRLPVPLMNILNGGAHADNGLDVQEFMIAPICGGKFSEALRAGVEVFHTLKSELHKQGLSTAVGDEGGFAPKLKSNLHALELVAASVSKAGYKLGTDIVLALDVAATELYAEGKYRWDKNHLSSEALIDVYAQWVKDFPLKSIEDGLSEDDWDGWKKITQRLGKTTQLVGDDLFVTNPRRIKRGIEEKAANAVLIKVNQIGSLSETREAIRISQSAGFRTVMSHRSGETEDATIADLAVATGSQQIKTGSLCRGERTAKYNQLLRIEEELGSQAGFWGAEAFL